MRLYRVASETNNYDETDTYLGELAIKYTDKLKSVNITPELLRLWEVYYEIEIEYKISRIKEIGTMRHN